MVPHPQGLEGVLELNDLLDVVGDGGDDLINKVHHHWLRGGPPAGGHS